MTTQANNICLNSILNFNFQKGIFLFVFSIIFIISTLLFVYNLRRLILCSKRNKFNVDKFNTHPAILIKSISKYTPNFSEVTDLFEKLMEQYAKCAAEENDVEFLLFTELIIMEVYANKLRHKTRFKASYALIISALILFLSLVFIIVFESDSFVINQLLQLFKSPFILILLLPIYLYIKFSQPRESWVRFSTTWNLFYSESVKFIYELEKYNKYSKSYININIFQTEIVNILSLNVKRFADNMKRHVSRENKLKIPPPL